MAKKQTNKSVLNKKILEWKDVAKITPDLDLLSILPEKVAEKVEAVIFGKEGKTLKILTTNNHPTLVSQFVEQLKLKGYEIDFFYTDKESFSQALKWYDILYQRQKEEQQKQKRLLQAHDKTAEELIHELFEKRNQMDDTHFIKELIRLAFQAGSSDLHFQSENSGVVMRVRKDGVLKNLLLFSHEEFKKYYTIIKFLSGVRLNVKDIPQDGRFSFDAYKWNKKVKIDVRVSFMPGLRGENIVMRFLDSSKGVMSFTEIWFLSEQLEILERNITKSHGMILMTGPTWSGKTTTLYSILSKLNSPDKKIITLEDPVEYELPWIQQSQINEKKGYTYEEWLKAILRQDPDIILVWEIRNLETAKIAINAALTGHLVLSTLHTNSAVGAISRLLNMGVKPYMLAPALNLIIGQRLVRRLHTCKSRRPANMAESQEVEEVLKRLHDIKRYLGINFKWKLPQAVWCEWCDFEWFKGRVAILEELEIDDDIRGLILKGKWELEIFGTARTKGFVTLKEDWYIKMLKGYTTLEEIRKVF